MSNDTAVLSDAAREALELLLTNCGCLRSGEGLVVVGDPTTAPLAAALAELGRTKGARVTLFEVPELAYHGAEPTDDAAAAMLGADLVCGITAKSMAHSEARRKACAAGARYLSLPDYNIQVLEDPSLRADFATQAAIARRISDLFTSGRSVRVTSALGTDVTLDITDRIGNCCPGFVQFPGDLGSPPDIESNVSPIETASEGVVVVDGSIPFPGLGRLAQPVTLTVRGGSIVRFDGEPAVVARLEQTFASINSSAAYVLAECGIGLNPMAQLCGNMLIDEGAAGTMHFGFGSNYSVGGRNKVPFHLDFIFNRPSLFVDGTAVLRDGVVVL